MSDEPRLATESIAGLRPYQEDSVLAKTLSDGRVLVAVADGMGGHAAGEVASALALETLEAALEDGVTIDSAFALANVRVHEKAKEPDKHGMGTTLTAALVDDGEYMIANVGDSRGYLVSAAGIRQVTQDHSFVAEAMKRGQTEAEAMDTPWRDALTRSIGTDPEVEVDVFGPFPVEDDTALLICSDGLYKTLSDDDLRDIFSASGTPLGAAQTLVATALERGSDDNITVAIAEYGEVPRAQGQATVTLEYDPSDEPDDLGPVTEDPDLAAEDLASVGAPSAVPGTPVDLGVAPPDLGGAPANPLGSPTNAVIVVAAVVVGFIAWVLLFGL